MINKVDRYDFIWKSIQKHGYKYDYRESVYVDRKTKVKIICDKHGEFWHYPRVHYKGCGCNLCFIERHCYTKEEFIKMAKEKLKDKYDYSYVEFVNMKTKVKIKCNRCGNFFEQTPQAHLRISGDGCKHCAKNKKMTKEEFVKKAQEVHKNKDGTPKYDYSKVEYVNCDTKVCIICPIHGEFWQSPYKHIHEKNGCQKCGYTTIWGQRRKTTEEFINECNIVHNFKYDYSEVVYTKNTDYILIGCKKHGFFKQRASNHLRGDGCPKCNQSFLERDIEFFLNEKNINFIYQASKKDLDWLGQKRIDFYLPEYNIAIECQGIQHFKPVDYFGGKEEFEKVIKRDTLKKELCEANEIKLLYFSNLGIEYPYQVFEDKEELLNEIIKNKID